MPHAAAHEDRPDRPHRTRVGDLAERLLGPRALRGVLALQILPQLRQLRPPELIGLLLPDGLLFLGGELLGLDPTVSVLDVAQMLPDGLARGIEPEHLVVVGQRLLLQAIGLAPGRQPRLGVRRPGRPRAALQVLMDQGLLIGVVPDPLRDGIGLLPKSLISDQPQEGPGQHIRRLIEDRPRQVLEPLGRQAVGFAPQGQPHLGSGVMTGYSRGRLVRLPLRQIDRGAVRESAPPE